VNAQLSTKAGLAPLLLLPGTLCDGAVFAPALDLVPAAPLERRQVISLVGDATADAPYTLPAGHHLVAGHYVLRFEA